ncbi:MAG: hypothetical protein ACH349_01315 [Candidatus Rhabdochlamydia sp.]
MLSQKTKEALKNNWGEKAETLNCYAEVKLIDPLSSWACYIFAMDDSEELIHCLLYSAALGVEIYTQCMYDICSMYNENGESPIIDNEYRRMRVTEILRRLSHDT